MVFRLPEYDLAFGRFYSEAVHELAAAVSPILSEMQFEPTTGALGSVIQDQQGEDVDLKSSAIQGRFTLDANNIREGDLTFLWLALDETAQEISSGLTRSMFETLGKVTDATGNVVDAEGNLTFEKLMEMLRKIELTLDDDGNLALPTIFMNPADVEKLPEPTASEKARMDEFLDEKVKELRARRRRRRLS